jgi:hypothetical protein
MFSKAVAITGILERIIQFALAGVSAWAVTRWAPATQQQIWIPLGIVGLYVVLAAALYFFVNQIDARTIFVGKYLSVPDDGKTHNIFEVKSKLLGTEYRLDGTSYTQVGDVVQANGTWNSDQVTLHVEDRELQYIYWGRTVDGTVNGWGYSNIYFTESGIERGRGYFIDESKTKKPNAPERKDSRYVKLTPPVIEAVMKTAGKAIDSSDDEREFIKAFRKLDAAEQEKLIGVAKT